MEVTKADKKRNYKISEYYRKNNQLDRAYKVSKCGKKVEIIYPDTGEIVTTTWLCKDRMCPTCREFKVKKEDAINFKIDDDFDEYTKIFYTLTHPSITIEDFHKTLTEMNRNFQKVIQRRNFFKEIYKGHVAKASFTRIKNNKINLHIHGVLFLDSSSSHDIDTCRDNFMDYYNSYYNEQYYQIDFEEINSTEDLIKILNYVQKEEFDYGSIKDSETFNSLLLNTTGKGKKIRFYGGCFKEFRKKIMDKHREDYRHRMGLDIINKVVEPADNLEVLHIEGKGFNDLTETIVLDTEEREFNKKDKIVKITSNYQEEGQKAGRDKAVTKHSKRQKDKMFIPVIKKRYILISPIRNRISLYYYQNRYRKYFKSEAG